MVSGFGLTIALNPANSTLFVDIGYLASLASVVYFLQVNDVIFHLLTLSAISHGTITPHN